MIRDPLDHLRQRNPVPPEQLPSAPMALASEITSRRSSVGRGLAIAAAAASVVIATGGAWLLWSRGGGDQAGPVTTPTTMATPTTLPTAEPPAPVAVVYFLAHDPLRLSDLSLVPVARDLAVLDVRPPPDLGPLTVDLLLYGPGPWDAGPLPEPVAAAEAGLTTAIPEGTHLLGLAVEDGVATVNLSAEFATATPEALAQVVFTLTRLEGVDGVRFLIDGVPHSVVAGAVTLVPTASPPEGAFLEDPATRLVVEGLMPIAMIESPALGGTLQIPGTVTGVANPFGWRVGLTLTDTDGVVLWERVVEASCGTPWQPCRGEYDWSIFNATVPSGLVDYGRWGTLSAHVFTDDPEPRPYAVREQPVWLEPSVPFTEEPDLPEATTSTTIPAPASTVIDAGPAPWSAYPLPVSQVPESFAAEWAAAENRAWCSALYPAFIDDLTPEVRARIHEGAGWGFAWDLPSGPGRADPENPDPYCADCGREAFGVYGVEMAAVDQDARWPNHIEWADGSRAGYGYEGDEDPSSGAPLLAYVVVDGQGCFYQVWSFLGEEHLLELISRLRFVEGMQADLVVPLGLQGIEPVEIGDPPWGETALDPAAVPAGLLQTWRSDAGAPPACPLLAPSDMGAAAEAVLRRRSGGGELAVSWDRTVGPGRGYPYGEYCTDCGWSALGLETTLSAGRNRMLDAFPATHIWSDGSRAWVMPEGTWHSGGIPDDRLTYTDGLTGEPLAVHPYVAFLQVEGFDCGYYLWSFLGEDHLLSLIDGLRRVAGYP